MKCHLEITGAILRIFNEDDAKFGDPFDMVLFVVADEGVATLKGFKGDALAILKYREVIRQCLAEHGFTEVNWTRHTNGETQKRKLK